MTHITFIGALYHPPRPQYQSAALLDYIEAGIDAVTASYPSATIVLAGDFNSLCVTEVATRGALLSIVDRPTRGTNMGPTRSSLRQQSLLHHHQSHRFRGKERSQGRHRLRRSSPYTVAEQARLPASVSTTVTGATCEISRIGVNAEHRAR